MIVGGNHVNAMNYFIVLNAPLRSASRSYVEATMVRRKHYENLVAASPRSGRLRSCGKKYQGSITE